MFGLPVPNVLIMGSPHTEPPPYDFLDLYGACLQATICKFEHAHYRYDKNFTQILKLIPKRPILVPYQKRIIVVIEVRGK